MTVAAEPRRCAVCGASLKARSRTAKYCGSPCKHRAARARQRADVATMTPGTATGAARVRWPELVVAAFEADPRLADLADPWRAALGEGESR